MTTIAALREARGWSRWTLARQINVNHNTVIRWEVGLARPNPNSLRKLAAVFAVALEDIDVESPYQRYQGRRG